MIFSIPPQ
jgi:hypothetical protein